MALKGLGAGREQRCQDNKMLIEPLSYARYCAKHIIWISSVKKINAGARPVTQLLSLHVLLLGGLGFAGSDPGCGHGMPGKPCCGRCPTYKVEEDGHGC